MQFAFSRTFPARRAEGFEYLMDLTTWKAWNPIEIRRPSEASFVKKGDKVDFTYRPLGIPVHGRLFLEEIRKGEFVEMRFEQGAFGDVLMKWQFENAGAHAFTLTAMFEVVEPTWWEKTMHRMSMVLPAMRRDVRESFEALHDHFAAHEEAVIAS